MSDTYEYGITDNPETATSHTLPTSKALNKTFQLVNNEKRSD